MLVADGIEEGDRISELDVVLRMFKDTIPQCLKENAILLPDRLKNSVTVDMKRLLRKAGKTKIKEL